MSRTASKERMGFYAISEAHHAAITSLVAPATPATRILDPFAGEGDFLQAAAQAWNVTPYANELDGERAAKCIERFGPKQAVRCDAERLNASNNAFGLLWVNPPYDHDRDSGDNKRVEFRYLRHSWKWAQAGSVVMWCVYVQHITEAAAAFLAKHSRQVDVYALPGKHLGAYDQMVVVAIKGQPVDSEALYESILAQKVNPTVLDLQPEPLYKMPPPITGRKFVFAPDMIDHEQGLRLIEQQGAWGTNGFQSLLSVPEPPAQIEPVVAPRPGHMALVLAAGVANGAVIEVEDYGQVAIRGKTQHVEQVARVEVEADPNDPDRQVKKTTVRLKPSTVLTLLAGDGRMVEMDGDDALLDFITRNKSALASYLNDKFKPMYAFDYNGIRGFLDRIRLKGKYPLYGAQKHVIAAITRGFQDRDSMLLVGQMGVGKTAQASSAAIAMASGAVGQLRGQMRDDQVVLVICPPHLIEKWERELHSISSNIYVQALRRHEDVKAFMEKSARLGPGIAKIGLIKRDMTKLGAGREVAVVWRNEATALWRHDQPTPEGYEPNQRIVKQRVPKCPCCGQTVMQERKGTLSVASENWLKSGKRTCPNCQTALWQEARDNGSRPKAGQKYASKNPRYRIDEYIQRQYSDRVYLLIWDEVHEAAHGSTGNGESFGRLAGVAQKVLALTGTPFNGKASSLFNIQYHLNPRVRERFPWGRAERMSRKERGSRRWQTVVTSNKLQRGRAESRWVAAMGVRERVVEERPSYDSETGAFTGTSTYERPYEEAPGISPLLVAEMLDHSIYFSLADLGKALPRYEEIAVPVTLDVDIAAEYERTRSLLKDYLVQRRWEGDVSFRGAFLQWSMGWVNAAFRPEAVIHNIKHPIKGDKRPHVVTRLPSFGEDRIYAKEQALIDLVQSELQAGRPCVVYLRQTGTRDIQARIEQLIRQQVPEAEPYVLKSSVTAERREQVIEQQVRAGCNVIINNPELVKTGLDLIFAPTLIFFELTFNLATMMQAAARSYRLNQTHEHCKVYYLFAEGTMEHTAVQLMSRKQRAAKLLTGEVGLTGLDAITEGEGGFEAALLDAIAKDESLIDPSEMFAASESALDAEDAAYWNVEVAESETDEAKTPDLIVLERAEHVQDTSLPVGPVLMERSEQPRDRAEAGRQLLAALRDYLDEVHIVADDDKFAKLQARLIDLLLNGEHDDNADVQTTVGLLHTDFATYPVHREKLTRRVASWLKRERMIFTGYEDEVAERVLALSIATLAVRPTSAQAETPRKRDLLAAPTGDPLPPLRLLPRSETQDMDAPRQLALL